MHYDPFGFSSDGQPNILTNDPNAQDTIGQRSALSFNDVKKMNFAYCNQTCPVQLNCLRSGYTGMSRLGSEGIHAELNPIKIQRTAPSAGARTGWVEPSVIALNKPAPIAEISSESRNPRRPRRLLKKALATAISSFRLGKT